MPLPFRSNPNIKANWFNTKSGKFLVEKEKKAYYEISTKEAGKITIRIREEKKRLGGSAEREEFWYSFLGFELDSTFAKDLKMFLNEYVVEEAPEAKQTIRLYLENGKWCARLSEALFGKGNTKLEAIRQLSEKIAEKGDF